MKEGWEYKTLGEVVSFSRGLTYKKSDEVDYSTKVVLRSTNINVDNNSLNIDELKYLNENIEVEEEKLIKKGAILICMSNGSKKHLGKVALIEHDYKYAFGGFMGLLTPVIKINSKYLYYTLTTPKYKEYIKSLSEGANINNLKIKDIQKYIIPIFPLDEQRRIVSYLDSSFKLIDEIKNKALKSLTEAKALFQSALAEATEPKEGWEEKTLKEIGLTQTGTTPSKSNKAYYGNYIPFIRPSEINIDGLGTIEYNSEIMLSQKGIEAGRKFTKKSILMVCIGATIGKVGYSERDISCNQQINVLSPYNGYNYKYLYYAMSSSVFQKKVIMEGTSAQATLPIINKGKWEKLLLYIPPLSTQKQIVSRLDKLSSKVRAIEEKYHKMVEECDALKQAMLRDVFE